MDKNNIMIGTWAWGTGANGSSIVFGKKQDPAVLKQSFAKAVESGFLHWDTAAVYGMGTCETLLGELIQNHDNIFISTKFMPDKKFKSGALVQSFEDSMKRLKRNNADLFWIHVPHDVHFHDIVMIWLLRRLDLGAAKREIHQSYGDLFESGELKDMSKDDLTMFMLEILDRYELPHTIKCAEDFKFLHYVPF